MHGQIMLCICNMSLSRTEFRAAYLLPSVTRRYIGRLARKARDELDVDDARVLRAGAFGAPEARAAREEWERAHAAADAAGVRS